MANESQQILAALISQPTNSGILAEMKSLTVSTTIFGTFVLELYFHGFDFEVILSVSESKVGGVGFVHLGER